MNLYLRMFWVYLSSFFRPRLPIEGTVSELYLISLPNDLDINRHVNNGRFLTYADLNRFDLFIRTGFLKLMLRNGWTPMIAEHTMTYKKSLKVFKKFKAIMVFESYDEKYFYMVHRFEIAGIVIAEGTSKAVIRSREGVVPPSVVLDKLRVMSGIASTVDTP